MGHKILAEVISVKVYRLYQGESVVFFFLRRLFSLLLKTFICLFLGSIEDLPVSVSLRVKLPALLQGSRILWATTLAGSVLVDLSEVSGLLGAVTPASFPVIAVRAELELRFLFFLFLRFWHF